MNGFYFNIQYRQDLQDYFEILNSRFPDETVKKSIFSIQNSMFDVRPARNALKPV